MAVKKAKGNGPKRKQQKRYTMVSFTLEDYEGEFVVPNIDQVPLGVQRVLSKGNVNKLADFLEQHAGEGVFEVFEEFGQDEVEAFMSGWQDATPVSFPKSEG